MGLISGLIAKHRGTGLLLRSVTLVRIFFVFALLAAGIVELWATNFFSTPIEQLGVSAVVGAVAVIGAKLIHAV